MGQRYARCTTKRGPRIADCWLQRYSLEAGQDLAALYNELDPASILNQINDTLDGLWKRISDKEQLVR